MTEIEALEVLRKLVFDGYRLFECGDAWQTLNTAVLGTTHNRPSTKLFTREQVVDALDGCSDLQSALSLFRQWGK